MDIAHFLSNSMQHHEECSLVYLLLIPEQIEEKSLRKVQGLLRGQSHEIQQENISNLACDGYRSFLNEFQQEFLETLALDGGSSRKP